MILDHKLSEETLRLITSLIDAKPFLRLAIYTPTNWAIENGFLTGGALIFNPQQDSDFLRAELLRIAERQGI